VRGVPGDAERKELVEQVGGCNTAAGCSGELDLGARKVDAEGAHLKRTGGADELLEFGAIRKRNECGSVCVLLAQDALLVGRVRVRGRRLLRKQGCAQRGHVSVVPETPQGAQGRLAEVHLQTTDGGKRSTNDSERVGLAVRVGSACNAVEHGLKGSVLHSDDARDDGGEDR
jgi:hypothetical protein